MYLESTVHRESYLCFNPPSGSYLRNIFRAVDNTHSLMIKFLSWKYNNNNSNVNFWNIYFLQKKLHENPSTCKSDYCLEMGFVVEPKQNTPSLYFCLINKIALVIQKQETVKHG